jgi:hypothetical protein
MVVYRGYQGAEPRFMERRRLIDDPLVVAVPPPTVSAPRRLFLLPNPIRAGEPVEFRWAVPTTLEDGTPQKVLEVLEVFDLAGRRMAEVDLQARGPFLLGRLSGDRTRTWPPGIYLARVRDVPGSALRLVLLR